jgi:hypothetical protein
VKMEVWRGSVFCHSRNVLSVGGSVWYLVRNLHRTVTVGSVLANSKTQRFLAPCPRHVSSRLPPSGETCKYAIAPITQTHLEIFSAYLYAPFCYVSWLLRCRGRNFRRDLRTTLYINVRGSSASNETCGTDFWRRI